MHLLLVRSHRIGGGLGSWMLQGRSGVWMFVCGGVFGWLFLHEKVMMMMMMMMMIVVVREGAQDDC